jgi:hypothetical protein
MAPSGFRTFVAGDILTAAQVNQYLMQQAVTVFASSSARDAAITSPSEGQVCFLSDSDQLQIYTGSAWSNVITATGAAATNRVEIVKFTATGSFSKASYPWASYAEITVVGGGGAGGGAENNNLAANDYAAGSGGGGGGTAIVYTTMASLATSETVTIGAGGFGAINTDGTDGGQSSFGTIAVATGGTGGQAGPADTASRGQGLTGGLGGIGTTGDLLLQGTAGGHSWISSVETGFSGGGGLSSFGGNNSSKVTPETGDLEGAGVDGAVPGAGGAGGMDSNIASGAGYAGGDGADGIVIVKLT